MHRSAACRGWISARVSPLQNEIDTLILGGGCAGLSLGARLAESPTEAQGRTLIVEARSRYVNDRTWCFWRERAHRWEHLVAHSWQQLLVQSRDAVASVSAASSYQMIESGAFYADAKRSIDASSDVDLRLGVDLTTPPTLRDGLWRTQIGDDEIASRYVVDTRPPQLPRAGDALLWQSFFGQEIECAVRAFDEKTVQLMDFVDLNQYPDIDGVMFTYVLPFSSTRALVETTVFGCEPLQKTALREHQARAVARLCAGSTWRVAREEGSMLPMGMNLEYSPPGENYVRVGLMSGGARASTGYAFQRIQRWADQCAAAIKSGRAPCAHAPDSALMRWMDRLFLRVIRDQPERAPEMFVRLFSKVNSARVIRFLSDEATLADCAAIVAALPPTPFLRTLLRRDAATRFA